MCLARPRRVRSENVLGDAEAPRPFDRRRHAVPGVASRLNLQPPEALAAAARRAAEESQSAIFLATEDRALAVFAIADAIRAESREAVARLHARGVEVAMLTGDAEAVASSVARDLAIDSCTRPSAPS